MSVLAIVPARIGSKGIPRKNFRELAGRSPAQRALDIAFQVCDVAVLTSDDDEHAFNPWWQQGGSDFKGQYHRIYAGPPLHTDDCPMIDVVKDVLARVSGPDDQIIVLLQPTQPLRRPEHVTKAISMLRSLDFDSVVSIVAIPKTHAPEFALLYDHVCLMASRWNDCGWSDRPARRQAVPQPYIQDGTVYAFWRRTVAQFGNLYGECVGALEMDHHETCALDTEADWLDAERRLHGLA